ncbi:MAG: hypothetical protein PVI21_01160 [Candidatus Woesebacteria bacterium]|jgi:hypothetical protein
MKWSKVLKRKTLILIIAASLLAFNATPLCAEAQTTQLQSTQQGVLQTQDKDKTSKVGSSANVGESLQPASSGKSYAQATRGLTVAGDTQVQTQSQGTSQWVTLTAATVGLVAFAAIVYVAKTRRRKHTGEYRLPSERPVEDEEIEEVFSLEEESTPKAKKTKKSSKNTVSKSKKTKKSKSKKRK